MKQFQSSFKFKADRDYVHGTDIYNYVMATLKDDPDLCQKAFTGITLAFLKRSVENITMYVGTADEYTAFAQKEQITFRGSLSGNGEKIVFFGIPNGIPVVGNYPYDEKSVETACEYFDGKINYNFALSNLSPIEILIPMHKILLAKKCPHFKGKWMFTRLDLDLPLDSSFKGITTLKIYNATNPKLVCSDIFQNGKKIGRIFFSLT
jgi:hypothetical protein